MPTWSLHQLDQLSYMDVFSRSANKTCSPCSSAGSRLGFFKRCSYSANSASNSPPTLVGKSAELNSRDFSRNRVICSALGEVGGGRALEAFEGGGLGPLETWSRIPFYAFPRLLLFCSL